MLVSRRLAGEMFWVFSGTLVSMSVALAGTRFLTTFISPAEYGRLALMISVAVLVDQVVGHAIGGAAMRFYPIYRAEGRLSELRRIILRSWLFGVAGGVLALIIVSFLQQPAVHLLPFLTIGFALGLLVSGIGVRLAEGARRRGVAAAFRSAFEVVRFGLAAAFILLGSATAESAMAGFMVGALVVAALHWYYAGFRLLGEACQAEALDGRTPTAMSFREYAGPLSVVGLGSWGFLMSPIWALGWHGELSEVGTFSAYYQLAFVPMLLVSGLLLTFLAPIVYETTMESIDKAMRGTYLLAAITLSGVIIVVVLAAVLHHGLAILLLGEAFRADSWIFPWLIMAGGMYGVAQQLLLRLRAEMKVITLAAIQLGFAAFAAASYSLAASHFALEGVVYAVSAVNAMLLGLSVIYGGVLARKVRTA
jgi:O-antigen/teichoic acid export membrane protein